MSAAMLAMLSLAACGNTDSSPEQSSESSVAETTVITEEITIAQSTESPTEAETTAATAAETTETSSPAAGVGEIQLLDASAENSELPAGNATVTIGNKQIDLSGAYVVDGESVELNGGNTLENANGQLVNAAAGRWGNNGANGSALTLAINGDSVTDSAAADDISSVTVNVLSGEFTGETSGDVTAQ